MPALSGQKTVPTAGSAVSLGSQPIAGPLAVKALPANTGVIYLGNDGAGGVSSSTGYPLSPGDLIIFEFVGDLANLWVNASVNGEGVAWLLLRL